MKLWGLIFYLIIAFVGCKKSEERESSETKNAQKQHARSVGNSTRDSELREYLHPELIPPSKQKNQLSTTQIREEHLRLMLSELPPYVKDVWGVGGFRTEGLLRNHWAFVVPKEHIVDFVEYLKKQGVPDDGMSVDTPFRNPSREQWTSPKPPARSLKFLYAFPIQADTTQLGLNFVRGQSRSFGFENPNSEDTKISLYFDPLTGNVFVSERALDFD